MSEPLPAICRLTPEQYAQLRLQFLTVVINSVKHAKKSLLDYIDAALIKPGHLGNPDDRRAEPALSLKRHVHEDVSLIQAQIITVFSIYESGGQIPPFGRKDGLRDEDGDVVIGLCPSCRGEGLIPTGDPQSGRPRGLKTCRACGGVGRTIKAEPGHVDAVR